MLEILLSLAAIALVVLMAGVYAYAPPDRKTYALAALAFVIAFAILTFTVHFVSLTVGRQHDPAAFPIIHRQLVFGEWPSLALTVDLLAWDFFLGLSLMFAAPVFKGTGLISRVRKSLIVAGTLCLAGTLGPATGQLPHSILRNCGLHLCTSGGLYSAGHFL